MIVNAIKNGIVLDHISAGYGMKIYDALNLEKLDCEIVILKNVPSKKLGKKDIIKINKVIELNFDAIGFINPDITVNIIQNGKIIEKKQIPLPMEIKNVLKCKNPRCITTIESALPHVFKLTNKEKKEYRCLYCETKGVKEN